MSVVSDVLDESRVLLNDVGATRFTNAILLPIFKKVYLELQRKLIRTNVPLHKEISGTILVTSPATSIPPGGGAGQMPADLLLPIKLEEATVAPDPTGTWVEMTERDWEPDEAKQSTLDLWVWREQEIKLRGATVNRYVRIYYIKSLAAITAVANTVAIDFSEQYLAAATAAVAAFVIGQNPSRAEALQSNAENDLEELMAYHTKQLQGLRVRRRAFRRPKWRMGTR
jgi:hypothetical protein